MHPDIWRQEKQNWPPEYVHPLDFESSYSRWRLVPPTTRNLLIIGPGKGQDYFMLKGPDRRIDLVDIAPQRNLPGIIVQDASKHLPFPDGTFEVIILGEVLEHMFFDVQALTHARRVLRDDGLLLVSVPYLSDGPEFHVRVHTEATIRRLLTYCGFRVETYVERGHQLNYPMVKWKRRIARVLAQLAGGRFDQFEHSLKIAERNFQRGQRPSRLRKYSRYFGGTFACRKGDSRDFGQVQVEHFSNMLDRQ